MPIVPRFACIAQPVEQRIRNAQVVSSSLTTSSNKNPVPATGCCRYRVFFPDYLFEN